MKRAAPLAMVVLLLATIAAFGPTIASSHPERPTAFPAPAHGAVPAYRSRGPSAVVCKADSRARIKRAFRSNRRLLRKRLAVLRRCRFHDIQAAINGAKSGWRILIMPGVYRELPSRAVAFGGFKKPPCADDYVETEGFSTANLPPPVGPRSNDPPVRANRNYTTNCPNSKNLIAVVSDPRPDPDPKHPLPPRCMRLCNLQIDGMGRRPDDVLIVADRVKLDAIRIDRSTGIYLRNFAVEQAAFNDVNLVEVDGFRISKVVARYAQDYGILSFTSIHGLYDHIEAYGNGDSGVYPGSNAKGCDYIDRNAYGTCDRGTATDTRAGCGAPTTELRDVNTHDNVLGYSGTAGNSTWVHDSEFHDNAAGLSTDSFASGHPGMPQECAKWEHNRVHSNNDNVFTAARQSYCNRVPFENRTREIVCPQFQVPVGTGFVLSGANRNLLRGNYVYDNWKWGMLLHWVPATLRGDNALAHLNDTSNGNQLVANRFGVRADGTRDPNGLDVMWDEQGKGNCWQGNTFASGRGRRSNPAALPGCPNPAPAGLQSVVAEALLVPCAAWDPRNNPRPIACDWFDTPREPK
jgi:hypothetical protein